MPVIRDNNDQMSWVVELPNDVVVDDIYPGDDPTLRYLHEDVGRAYLLGMLSESKAGPDTSPLSQLNLSSCVPVTTQLISLIHSEMLKLS